MTDVTPTTSSGTTEAAGGSSSTRRGDDGPARWPALRRVGLLGVAVALALGAFATWDGALAATFSVNTTSDGADANVGDGVCATAAGACTLRAAIQEANATAAADTISVPAGTYTLTIAPAGDNGIETGDLDVTRPLIIAGAGAAATVLDGGEPAPGAPPDATALDRLLELHPTAGNVTLSGLALREGYGGAEGGALYNASGGTVRLTDVRVRDSFATDYGGGVYNLGTLIVERSDVTGNATEGVGGGIYTTSGALTVTGTPDAPSTVSHNAADSGGGIYNAGELTAFGLRSSVVVNHTELSDNEAADAGAAIGNTHEGSLTLTDATVSANTAVGQGGGVHSDSKASATITRVDFSDNAAVEGGGGGLYFGMERAATVTDSTFSGNTSGEDGGGLFTEGTGSLTISGSTVEASRAVGEGGGIYLDNNGPVTVTDTVVRDNFAASGGGGIQNAAMRVTLRRLQVHGNTSLLDGGGIESQGSGDFFILDSNIYDNVAENGGGIANAADGRMLVSGTAVYDNRARIGGNDDTGLGGGIYILGDAGITIENSTFSGNAAQVRGGGVHVDADADTHMTHVTITRNAAPIGSGVAGEEGSINFPIEPSTDVIFRNSIVANNRLGEQCSFALGSEGGNIDSADSCHFRGARDRVNADPGLDAIADNGGPSLTHALRTESLAVDAGVSPCLPTDQRGVTRPQNVRCDSGAYEFEGPFLPPDTTPPQTEFLEGPILHTENTSLFRFTGSDDVTATRDLLFECRLIEFDPTEEPEPPDPTEPPPPELDWQSCHTPWEVPIIEDGFWTFEVRAIDRAGNVDPTPAVHEFSMDEDVVPPDTFFTETPPNPSFGRSATFSFSGTDNVTPAHLLEFECRIDSNDPEAWLECTNPQVYTNLSSGEHTVQVRAADLADNIDPTPATYTWTVAEPEDCDAANITLTATADGWVDQIEPLTNFVLDTELNVRSDGPARNARALFDFALPDDAPDCELESATLRLYAGSATTGRTLQALPVAGPWAEGTLTWNNQPATAGTPATTHSGDGHREWDVTDHVRAALDGASHHGWLIRDAVESDPDGGEQSFASRETPQDPPPVTLPRLVLRYEPAGGPPPEPPMPAPDETTVVCGQVLTESTTLANDLDDCPFEGLVVGAPNIVVDLNGHTISSGAPVEPGEEDGLLAGIRNGGHENVVIRNGTVAGFGYGVRLFATRFNVIEDLRLDGNILAGVELVDADDGRNGNTVRSNTMHGNETGVSLVADSENSVVEDNTFQANVGVGVLVQDSSGHRIQGNDVNGVVNDPLLDSDGGIRLEGASRNVIIDNTVTDTGDGGVILEAGSHRNHIEANTGVRAGDAAVTLSDSDDNVVRGNVGHQMADAGLVLNNANGTVVQDNDVRFNPAGIEVEGSEGNRIEGNDASDNQGDGILVGSGLGNVILDNLANSNKGGGIVVESEAVDGDGNPVDGNVIRANTAISNLGDGIAVAAGGHRIGDNAAHHNDGWGVTADPGAVDLGGNTASGNAEPEQCRGVVCGPGDNVPPIPADLTPPTTVITDTPPDPSDFLSATFHFTGTDDRTPPTALRFECRLDPLPDPPPPEPDPPDPGEDPEPVDPTDPDSWTECVSPMTYELLEIGEHRFEVRAIDAADNTDYSGDAFYEWTVISSPTDVEDDDVPPNTTIFDAPDDPSTATTATFRFRGSDNLTPGAFLVYECRLDGGALAPCTSPQEYSGLSLGSHTFEVRAVDLARNADPTPASHTWTIEAPPPDHTPPETTIDSGPDAVTVSTTATFTFSTNEDGSTFQCSLDESPFAACTSPVTYIDLGAGEHTFRVRATDPAGNTDPTPATYTWTIGSAPVPTLLECGDVVTQSTRLLDDLTDCAEDGLVIGAHGITIDLDGHTIDGTNVGAGIRNDGFDAVTVTNGTVQEFDFGVHLGAATTGNVVSSMTLLANQDAGIELANAGDATTGNTVRDNTITANGTGVTLVDGTRGTRLRDNMVAANPGDGVRILHSSGNRVEGLLVAASSEAGIHLEGASGNVVANNTLVESADAAIAVLETSNNNRIEGNAVSESEAGIILSNSDSNQVLANAANATSDIGVKLENAHDNVVRDNDLALNSGALQLDGSTGNLLESNNASESAGVGIELGDMSLENVLRRNTASYNDAEGIAIGDAAPAGQGNLIEGNVTNTNNADGIAVSAVGHMIADNTANDNDGWGIYAAEGSVNGVNVDGGGNRATGNSEPEQCFNVRCDGGPPFPSDQIPPETVILEGPPNPSFLRTATFEFSGTDNATTVTFECRLDGGAWAPCTSPRTYTDLALGPRTFEVRATDWSGNVDPTPATWNWTIEQPPSGVAPDTFVDSGPDPTTVSTDAAFTFSSDEPDTTFECSIDGAAFSGCTSPQAYSGLSVGEHTFAVRAIDDEGLVDPSPATYTWSITPPPSATQVSCGQVLTQSTLVTNDLSNCPGDGLVVGANSITIDLNGRVIDGVGQGAGVRNNGFDSVTIRGGTVTDFDFGVLLQPGAARNVVAEMMLQNNQDAGIQLVNADENGAGNTLRANTISNNEMGIYLADGTQHTVVRDNSLGSNAADGIRVENSSANLVDVNRVSGSSDAGVAVEGGGDNTVVGNTLLGNSSGGIAVGSVELPSHDNTVQGNAVTQTGSAGILVVESQRTRLLNNIIRQSGSDALVLENADDGLLRANDVRSNAGGIALEASSGNDLEANNASATLGSGISLEAQSNDNDIVANMANSNNSQGIYVAGNAPAGLGNLIDRNTATSNGDDGISVNGSGHTISRNTADFNDGWGIYAVTGNIDGGGNRATGNAEPAQCFNIVCEIGTPPGAPDTEIVMKPPNPSNSRNATFTFTGFDDITAPADLDFECRLDSTSDADWAECENPQEYQNLAPGSHTFEVRAIDQHGFIDPTPASYTWVYEPLPSGVAPDTFIDLHPPAETWLLEGFFTFSSNEPDATFECQLDDGPWQPCAFVYEFQFEEFQTGLHTFRVRATDFEGNTDPTPAEYTWRILGVMTTITSGPAFIPPSEPGEPAEGGETEETSATFEFHANVADATFMCSLDLAPFEPCTSPVTYAGPLAVGEHLFRVFARDPETGREEEEPVEYGWTIVLPVDTTPPDTQITRAPANNSSETVFEFTGTDDRTFPEALTFECRLDSTLETDWTDCVSPFNLLDEWPDLTAGVHTFEVRAVDEEDNVDPTPASHTWTSVIDTVAPDTTILSGPPAATGEIDFLFDFTGSDNATPEESLEFECALLLDGEVVEPFEACDSPHSVQGLDPGSYELQVRAVDLAGNIDATPATWTWTVVGPPETTITSGPAELITVRTATFEFTADQDNVTFECSLNGSDFLGCTSPHTVQWLANDQHTFEVRATNEFGLVDDTAAEWGWTVEAPDDTEAPDTSVLEGPPSPSPRTVTFTFEGLDDVTPPAELNFDCSVDGSDFTGCESPEEVRDLADGEHTFAVRAVDAVGNVDPTPATWTWTVDGPPTTTITSGPGGETERTDARFEFEADEPGVTFECWLDGPVGPCTSGIEFTELTAGREHVFGVRATDAAGNVEVEWVEYEWDIVPPQPPDTTILSGPEASTSATAATFTFTGSDNVTGEDELRFECSLDGAAFGACESPLELTGLAAGAHTLRVRAIDAADLVDPTPATYSWTVEGPPDEPPPDETPPTVTLAGGPDATTTDTSATFTFTADEDATFQCALDGADYAACTSPVELTDLAVGEHTFAVRATDDAGNTSDPLTHRWTIVEPDECDTSVTVSADADAWVTSGSPSANNGADNLLRVGRASSSTMRSLVRFPVPEEEGCVVESATLRLFATAASNGRTLQVFRAAAPWSETDVTWSNQPATTGAAATTSSGTGWREWVVTEQVVAAQDVQTDHGFVVRDANENANGQQQFASREHGTNPPELVVTFEPAPEPDSTPPETTITEQPPDPSDSGTATFRFSGSDDRTPTDSLTYQCRLDEGAFADCESPKAYSSLGSGPHSFEVRAVDQAGNADPTPASYTWTVAVACEPATVTADVTEDSWVSQSTAGTNYGSDSLLRVISNRGGNNARVLVRFDLPTLPDGCQVVDAQLRLHADSATAGRTLQAYRVNADWVEGTVTWGTQPTVTGAAATTPSGAGYREWTVTPHVDGMYSTANHGFLIRDASENGNNLTQEFASREAEANPPRLVITFGQP